ncbi:hypothetical protein REH81_15085 [Vibrio rotiferianus]
MSRYSRNKDINNYIKSLIKKTKWTCAPGTKHFALISPLGKKITIPGSPSDHRAFSNFVRNIEKIKVSESAMLH